MYVGVGASTLKKTKKMYPNNFFEKLTTGDQVRLMKKKINEKNEEKKKIWQKMHISDPQRECTLPSGTMDHLCQLLGIYSTVQKSTPANCAQSFGNPRIKIRKSYFVSFSTGR